MFKLTESYSGSPINNPDKVYYKQLSRILKLPPTLGFGDLTDKRKIRFALPSLSKRKINVLESQIEMISTILEKIKKEPTDENLKALEKAANSLRLLLTYQKLRKHIKQIFEPYGLNPKYVESYFHAVRNAPHEKETIQKQLKKVKDSLNGFLGQLDQEYAYPTRVDLANARLTLITQAEYKELKEIQDNVGQWPFIKVYQTEKERMLFLEAYSEMLQSVEKDSSVFLFIDYLTSLSLKKKSFFDINDVKTILRENQLQLSEEIAVDTLQQMMQFKRALQEKQRVYLEMLQALDGQTAQNPHRLLQKGRTHATMNPKHYLQVRTFLKECLEKIALLRLSLAKVH